MVHYINDLKLIGLGRQEVASSLDNLVIKFRACQKVKTRSGDVPRNLIV